jgi:opacity protein-like surface antigen
MYNRLRANNWASWTMNASQLAAVVMGILIGTLWGGWGASFSHAQEEFAQTVQDESERREPHVQQKAVEIYGGVYLLGSLAKNRDLNVGGEASPQTKVGDHAGGGIKAGIFPAFTNYVVGIQAEMFGLGSEITAPQSLGSGGIQSGRGTMLAWNTLVSLIVRYPGEQFQPYIGAGAGWSSSLLVGTDLMKGTTTQSGIARDMSFAYQYFTGLRVNLTERVFAFGEYKFFGSRFNWSGSLQPSLDFRTHIVALGAGLSF